MPPVSKDPVIHIYDGGAGVCAWPQPLYCLLDGSAGVLWLSPAQVRSSLWTTHYAPARHMITGRTVTTWHCLCNCTQRERGGGRWWGEGSWGSPCASLLFITDHRDTYRDTHTHTYIHTHILNFHLTHTYTDTHRDTHTHRDTPTHTHTHKHTHTHMHAGCILCKTHLLICIIHIFWWVCAVSVVRLHMKSHMGN